MTTDKDNVRMSLGNAGSDGPDANRGDQLDVDSRRMIGVLNIMNKLCQILN